MEKEIALFSLGEERRSKKGKETQMTIKFEHFLIAMKNGEPPIGITMAEGPKNAALAYCSPDEQEGYDIAFGERVAGGRVVGSGSKVYTVMKSKEPRKRLAQYLIVAWIRGDIPRWLTTDLETPQQRGYFVNVNEFVKVVIDEYVYTRAEYEEMLAEKAREKMRRKSRTQVRNPTKKRV